MEEEKLTKLLLSYEEVIEVMDKHISRGEPAVCDKRIVRVEKVAEQMEEDRKKGDHTAEKFFSLSEIHEKVINRIYVYRELPDYDGLCR